MTIDYVVDIDEMQETIKLTNPKVAKNVTLVTPKELGVTSLLHISLDKRTTLFPNISKRAGTSEDNTLPRVHVSITLAGCWAGYATGGDLAVNNIVVDTKVKQSSNKAISSVYKGGFYIHEIDFRCGLKPNKQLVYDAKYTDEVWLTTYNTLTRSFKAKIVGIVFPSAVSYYPRTGGFPLEVTTLCVKIEKGYKVKLTDKKTHFKPEKDTAEFLTEGYWKFKISGGHEIGELESIKKEEFEDLKLKSAALLSYQ